jgi:hypothetical protein
MPTCRWYTKAEAHATNEILFGYATSALRAAHQNDSAKPSSQLERLGEANNNALPLLRSTAVSIDCEDITAQPGRWLCGSIKETIQCVVQWPEAQPPCKPFFDGCAFLLIGGE